MFYRKGRQTCPEMVVDNKSYCNFRKSKTKKISLGLERADNYGKTYMHFAFFSCGRGILWKNW